jgi:7-cyano-7-deazaguanine synthase in queuosine biosynthesis
MVRRLSMGRSWSLSPQIPVLLSGGIDSPATLAGYRQQRAAVIFVNPGQSARQRGWQAAQAIARHYGVELVHKRLGMRLSSQNDGHFAR